MSAGFPALPQPIQHSLKARLSAAEECGVLASRDEKLRRLSRLFKQCLHLGDDASIIQRSLEELQHLEPNDVSDHLSREAQLAPLLFWHLKRRGLTSLLSEPLASDLKSRYQINIARNFLFERGLEKILDRFDREGVEVIVLKGGSIFASNLSVFKDAFVLFDLDLLVRPGDLQKATELLISDGYSLTENQAMDGGVKRGFLGADNFAKIDLHSALFWTGVRLNYLDYFPSDLWDSSILDSLGRYPLRILSAEDQICYRLAHDAIGHQTLLLSNTCRLYYLCVLVQFHHLRIDWGSLLQKLKQKGSDRLLGAYLCYGKRELGLSLPPELDQFCHSVTDDVAYLDAITGSSYRMLDYRHRASIAALTTRNFQERLKRLYQLAVPNGVSFGEGKGTMARFNDCRVVFKVLCLQLVAVLYVSVCRLRQSRWKG